jgi:hypothetical protein
VLGSASSAPCEALDDIMKAKLIRVAVPQDFAPFGSAGLDLKPQGGGGSRLTQTGLQPFLLRSGHPK